MLSVSKVTYDKSSLEDGNNYALCFNFSDETYLTISLSGDKYNNKDIDLSKVDTADGWYWVFGYDFFSGYGDPNAPYLFDSGSMMRVTCLNKAKGEFEVTFSVKMDEYTMSGYYKGTFTPVDYK